MLLCTIGSAVYAGNHNSRCCLRSSDLNFKRFLFFLFVLSNANWSVAVRNTIVQRTTATQSCRNSCGVSSTPRVQIRSFLFFSSLKLPLPCLILDCWLRPSCRIITVFRLKRAFSSVSDALMMSNVLRVSDVSCQQTCLTRLRRI